MAIVLAILCTLCIAGGEHLASGATARTRANEITSGMFVSGVALTAVVAVAWPGDPTGSDLVFGGLAGICNGAGILLLYLAYSRGSLRSAAPAAAVVMSIVPIAWDVISGVSPGPLTWIGIVVGVVAIGLTSRQPADGEDDRFGVVLAILAGLVFGVLLILLAEVEDGAGGTPLFVQRLPGFIVAIAVTRATGPRILPANRNDRITSFFVGLFATSAVVLFVLAVQAGGSLATVSVIGSQYAAVAVVLGVVLRGQKLWWWQGLGLAMASVAVALITVG